MRGGKELSNTDDSTIFPSSNGKKLIFLDKEALLARLSDIRSTRKQKIIDRFFYLSRNQGFYYTDVYVMAEVFSTINSKASAEEMAKLRTEVLDSSIRIRHGNNNWKDKNLTESPKDVFLAAVKTLENHTKIDCKLPETTLVMQAAAADANYVFSYDEAVRKLSRSFDIDTLPYVEIW